MKRVLVLIFLSLLLLILDNAVVPFFAIKGFYPSLLFLFAVCYSIVNGTWEALWFGIFTGVLQDVYFFNGFGVNTLLNMLICVAAAIIGGNIFKEKSLIPIAACFVLSLLKGVFITGILYTVGQNVQLSSVLFNSIYGFILSIFIYRWVYKLCQKQYMQINWKFYDK